MIFYNKMTKEDIEYLEKYELNFKTAINANYTRNVTHTALDRMLEIYQRETGKTFTLCKSCTSSVLAFLKVIGKIYLVQKGKETQLNNNELANTVTEKEQSDCIKNKRVKKK